MKAPRPKTALTALVCAGVMLAASPQAEAQGREAQSGSSYYSTQLNRVFEFIQKHYVDEVDAEKLYEGAMKGMLESLDDPYSVYLAEKDMAELNQSVIQGNYGGVGLYITKPDIDGKSGYVEIASPIEDTPGWRAGLQPGDLIIAVNGKPTTEMTLDDVLAILKGPAGEAVDLGIRRGEAIEFPVTLVRAIIEVPTVKYAMIGSDTGYVRLISFSNHTAERTKEALLSFHKHGYKNLIIDLRNNYGGLLNAAVDVCSLFLKNGPVVSVKSRIAAQNQTYSAGTSPLVGADVPIVVLINKASASASEIVAGALKDRRRAYLIGERSFGKGSVQQVYPIDQTGFKITTARYYSPSDANIDKIGIPPDREVLIPTYTDEEAAYINDLYAAKRIPEFVKANPKAQGPVLDAFIEELRRAYPINASLLRRMVRDEQTRTEMPLVYDLDYDVQLQEAVTVLQSGAWQSLVQSTKTLKEIETEQPPIESAQASGSL